MSYAANSIINQAIEAVAGLINAMKLFSGVTRGALGTGNGLCCEIGPTSPEAVFLDKNQYIPIDLTINGKHDNLMTLSDAMNAIHETLTMLTTYPAATDWEIVDITTLTEPQIIGREDNNSWIMASALLVKVATDKTEPVTPTKPDEPAEPADPIEEPGEPADPIEEPGEEQE